MDKYFTDTFEVAQVVVNDWWHVTDHSDKQELFLVFVTLHDTTATYKLTIKTHVPTHHEKNPASSILMSGYIDYSTNSWYYVGIAWPFWLSA